MKQTSGWNTKKESNGYRFIVDVTTYTENGNTIEIKSSKVYKTRQKAVYWAKKVCLHYRNQINKGVLV